MLGLVVGVVAIIAVVIDKSVVTLLLMSVGRLLIEETKRLASSSKGRWTDKIRVV